MEILDTLIICIYQYQKFSKCIKMYTKIEYIYCT